jgi:hypothetical protein
MASRVDQVRSMLADRSRSWRSVAEFCASHRQIETLNLEPWESPPCRIDLAGDIGENEEDGAELLQRMLRAGISRFDPDPVRALGIAAAAERK